MPNWCCNHAIFTHENPKEIARLKKAFLEERTCDEFVPCPKELTDTVSPNRDEKSSSELIEKYGYSDWYTHNISEWGTKWDFGGHKDDVRESKKTRLALNFDTAWAPPITFYERMEEQGFTVEAFYYEPGMNFCGKFYDGNDYHYEIPSTSDEAAEQLPSDLDEMFSISEQLADREAEEDYNEEEYGGEEVAELTPDQKDLIVAVLTEKVVSLKGKNGTEITQARLSEIIKLLSEQS